MKANKNPWPGLASYKDPKEYKEGDGYLFCGRQNETYDLLQLIENRSVVTLYGSTGIGKTSLLCAGVFPILRQRTDFRSGTGNKNKFHPIYIRLSSPSQLQNDNIDNLSYSEILIKCLEKELEIKESKVRNSPYSPDKDELNILWHYFHSHCFYLKDDYQEQITPVVVLDQFEEVFAKSTNDKKTQCFFEQLYTLAEDRLPWIEINGYHTADYRFVISLREDKFFYMENYVDSLRLSLFKENRYRLLPLKYEQAEQVIAIPGEKLIEYNKKKEIARLIIEQSQSRDRGDINTLLLSLICNQIYEKSSPNHQFTLEKVQELSPNVLKQFYLDITSSLPITERQVMEHLLVKEGRRENVSVKEFLKAVPHGGYLLQQKEQSILRCDNDKVEVIHDQLATLIEEMKIHTKQQVILHNVLILCSCFAIILAIYFLPKLTWAKSPAYDGTVTETTIDGLREKAPLSVPSGVLNLAKKDTVFLKSFLGNEELRELHIGDSCYIDDLCFSNCKNLKSLYLDGKDISIYQNAFKGCDNLETIYVSDSCSMRYVGKQSGLPSLKNLIVNNNSNFVAFGENLLIKLKVHGETYWEVIGRNIKAKGYHIKIGDNSYVYKYLKYGNCVLPQLEDSIATDSMNVTYGVNWDIQNPKIRPDSAKLAILVCNDKDLKSQRSFIYYLDNIVGVNLPYIERFNRSLNSHKKLQFVNLPSAIYIDDWAFSNCSNLNSVYIPNVERIGDGVFQGCNSLTKIDMHSATVVGESAFNACESLKSISAPNLKTINKSGFRWCPCLEEIEFPNVMDIGNTAFEYCNNLKIIVISSALFIGDNAFNGCDSIQTIVASNNISHRFTDKSYCEKIGLKYIFVEKERTETTTTLEKKELEDEYIESNDTLTRDNDVFYSYRKLRIRDNVKLVRSYSVSNAFKHLSVDLSNEKYLSFKDVIYKRDTFVLNAYDVEEAYLMTINERDNGWPNFGNKTKLIYIDNPLGDFSIEMDSVAKGNCSIIVPYGFANVIRNSHIYSGFKSVEEFGQWKTISIKMQYLIYRQFRSTYIYHPLKLVLIIGLTIICIILTVLGYMRLIKKGLYLGLYTLIFHILGIVFTTVLFFTLDINYRWLIGGKIDIPMTLLVVFLLASLYTPWLVNKNFSFIRHKS